MMPRTSLNVRLGRLIQRLPLSMFRFVEAPFVNGTHRAQLVPPVFLLALPRSGSTLTYQLICHTFQVRYLTNLWNLLYQLPCVGGRLSKRYCERYESDFVSSHGFVDGLSGPAEGLRFWKYWMASGLSDEDSVVDNLDLYVSRSHYLKKVITGPSPTSLPFVAGYLGHSLIQDRLLEQYPGGVFIRLRRDPLSNALSLLKSTRTSGRRWFSVVPSECRALENSDEYSRVAGQIYWLNRRLDDSPLADDTLSLSYEELCDNPAGAMSRVKYFCAAKGLSLKLKGNNVPSKFEYRTITDIASDVDARFLDDAFRKLVAEHGPLQGYDI